MIKKCKVCGVKLKTSNSHRYTFVIGKKETNKCQSCVTIYNRKVNKKSFNIENYYRSRTVYWYKRLHDRAVRTSRDRKLKINITPEWILEKFKKQEKKCFWYKVPLTITTINHPLRPSLDRLNENGGYTKENTVISSKCANIGRNINNQKKWKNFINLIKKYN